MTIPRHFGAGRLGFKALAGPTIKLLHLHARQHTGLKSQQLALVGQRRVPAGGEMAAPPATDSGWRTGGVGGDVGGHGRFGGQSAATAQNSVNPMSMSGDQ